MIALLLAASLVHGATMIADSDGATFTFEQRGAGGAFYRTTPVLPADERNEAIRDFYGPKHIQVIFKDHEWVKITSIAASGPIYVSYPGLRYRRDRLHKTQRE